MTKSSVSAVGARSLLLAGRGAVLTVLTLLALISATSAQPTVSMLVLDLDSNQLDMTFTNLDPALDETTVDCTRIFIAGMMNDFATAMNNPFVGPAEKPAVDTIICFLDESLQQAVRSASATFGTGIADSFIYFEIGTGLVGGFGTELLTDTVGVQINSYTLDGTGPELHSFVGFDLDQGLVTLFFSEVVNVSSLNFGVFTFQSDFFSGDTYTLTDGDCDPAINCTDGELITFRILSSDLNQIKLLSDLCTGTTDCVPTYDGGFVSDFSANPNAAYSTIATPQLTHQLVSFIFDTTSPMLVNFDIDLSTDELTLEFDEPMSVATFNPGYIFLQASVTGGDFVQLTAESIPPAFDDASIVLSLNGDAHNVKLASFANSRDDTYLYMESTAITDVYGSSVMAIISIAAQQVRIFINDTDPPTLAAFILDLDSNELVLTFSEPIFADSILRLNFTLTINASVSLNLNGSTLEAAAPGVVVVTFVLDGQTLTDLKTSSSIGASMADTFIAVGSDSFSDVSNNVNVISQLIPATAIIADNTVAYLVDFSIDMNVGQISLTFNDVISVGSARTRRTISIQDNTTALTTPYDLEDFNTVGSDSTFITIDLIPSDFIMIKADTDIATCAANSFVTVRASAFNDLRGVDIIATTDDNAIMASQYQADVTPPVLDSFNFDLDEGLLWLTFDEPIDNSSFVFSRIQIQADATNMSEFIALQGGVALPNDVATKTVIYLTLSRDDLNFIKGNEFIATVMENTYFRLFFDALDDTAGNPIGATFINETLAGIPVSVFTPDTTPPAIVSFVLDLNSEELRITFDETINITTFIPTNLVLQSSAATDATEIPITAGMFTTIGPVVTLSFTRANINSLKVTPGIGETVLNTYLQALSGVVADTAVPVNNVAVTGVSVPASQVIPDTTPPEIERFVLDLNSDTLILTFDEPVNASSLDASSFTFYNSSEIALSDVSIPLEGTTDSSNGLVIRVQLPVSLALTIKTTPFIAELTSNTFLAYTMGAISDVAYPSGNPIDASDPVALQEAVTLIPDTSGPLVDLFDFDLDSGILTLHYFEPVDPTSLDATFITIQDNALAVQNYTLTGGVAVGVSLSTDIEIELTSFDLNAIKANTGLAVSNETTYLSLGSRALRDRFGNLVEVLPDGSAIIVSNFTADTSVPTVDSFDLRNAGNGVDLILVVVFSETINASTVDPTSFTLLEGPASPNNITLTGGTVSLVNSAEIEIAITATDLATIKSLFPLGSEESSSFLSAVADAGTDMVGLTSPAIDPANAVMARNITSDLIPPMLGQFSLNMDGGVLSLNFLEPVVTSTLDLAAILLQSQQADSTVNQTVTDSNLMTTGVSAIVNILLSDDELNALKVETSIATSVANTYLSLSIATATLQDYAGNDVIEIPTNAARQVDIFIPDTTGPEVVRYSLDMDNGVLVLTFSETIFALSLQQTAITLQDSGNISEASGAYTLTGGTLIIADSNKLTIIFTQEDFFGIQEQITLGASFETTFLVFTSDLLEDTNSNPAMNISAFEALQIRSEDFTEDTTNPLLQQYEFDLNTGTLSLTFTKVILVEQIDYTMITFQNISGTAHSDGSYFLTSSQPLNNNSAVIEIELTFFDLNAIKTLTNLAISRSTTWLSFTANAFMDIRGFPINATMSSSAQQAQRFVPDTTPPELISFGLDMNTGFLTFHFTEAMDITTFSISGATIANNVSLSEMSNPQFNDPASNVALNNGATIMIGIRNIDLNDIKVNLLLATSQNDTFIVLDFATIMDYAGLGNIGAGPVMAEEYFPDITGPVLTDYRIESTNGRIELTFNEAVNVSSFVIEDTQITMILNDSVYYLTSDMASEVASDIIAINLNPVDIATLSVDSALLAVTNLTVFDYSGNHNQPVGQIMDGGGGADTFPPQVVVVSFNLNSRQVEIRFTEVINIGTFDISGVTIMSSFNNPQSTYQFTCCVVSTTNGTVVIIQLTRKELNAILVMPGLGRDTASSVFQLLDGTVDDISRNTLTFIQLEALGYVRDTTPPVLLSWDFGLSEANITLHFNEPMDVSMLNPLAITIQNNYTNPTAQVTLTGGTTLTGITEYLDVEFQLDTVDANYIYLRTDLCTEPQNCFIAFTSAVSTDIFNNNAESISIDSAVQVTDLAQDTRGPALDTFLQLDLTNGTLTLSFTETVNVSTLDPTGLSLQSLPTPKGFGFESHMLTGGYTSSPNGATVTIGFLIYDLNVIKALQPSSLCLSITSCFARVNFTLIEDMSGNVIIPLTDPILPTFEGILSEYLHDTIPPQLVAFSLNLTSDLLSLTFDETVNYRTFRSEFISIQGSFEDTLSISLDPYLNRLITTGYSSAVDFTLSTNDVFNLKAINSIATGPNNTYITFLGSLISDIIGQSVVERVSGVNALQVTDYFLDTIRPQVVEFTELDMNEGLLRISFNEPILPQDITFSGITLQSSSLGGGSNVTLTEGTPSSFDSQSTTLTIELSNNDLRDIKLLVDLGKSASNSFLSVTSFAFSDPAGNPVVAIPANMGIPVIRYHDDVTAIGADGVTNDTTPPTITEFQLDFTLDRLFLTFDEPVRTSTLTNLTLFAIHSGEMPTPTHTVPLTGGDVVTVDDGVCVIIVILLDEDVTAIKSNNQLATSTANTFLSVQPSAIEDMNGNENVLMPRVTSTVFVPDETRPQLLSFSLDMNLGILDFTFNDVMQVSTFDPTAFRIQNTIHRRNDNYYVLQSSNTTSGNSYNIMVELTDEDFLSIKNKFDLARGIDSTWLTMQAIAIDDIDGVDVLAITNGKALQVTNYTVDDIHPELVSFNIDLNNGQLNLTFNDFMDAPTLNVQSIVLQNDTSVTDPTEEIQLAGGMVTRSIDGQTVTVDLVTKDLNTLKALPYLATSEDNLFLTIPNGSIDDLFGNTLLSSYADGSALAVTTFVNDTTEITVTSFDFDLNSGLLVLIFDETYLAESFNVTAITFQGERNASFRSDSYSLTAAENITFVSFTVVEVLLAESDLTATKMRKNVVSRTGNTYLSVKSNLIQDVSSNPTMPIFDDDGIRASVFIGDSESPALTNFTLDLNAGIMVFTFSDVVNPASVDFGILQIENTASSPTEMYILSEPMYDAGATPSLYLRVNLTQNELNALKAISGLAISETDTFLSHSSSFISDVAGNPVVPTTGLQVSEFISDTTPPELLMYSLNLDTGILVLDFSEIVDASQFDFSLFVVQNDPDPLVASESVALEFTTVTTDAVSYEVELAQQDINFIKLNRRLATTRSNVYLLYGNGSVLDILGNPIVGVATGIAPVLFIPDTTGPYITSFDLDFGLGDIILTFSEPVDTDTFLVTAYTLQNQSSSATPVSQFSLTLDSTVSSPSGDIVSIKIGVQDLNIIKSFNDLATGRNDTFITVTTTGVQDLSANPIQQIPSENALQVNNVFPDTLGPRLESFTLDLNSGELSITFGETISGVSIDLTLFTFQNTAASPTASVTLSAGTYPVINDIKTTIALLGSDLDRVKVANLGNSPLDTFLFLQSGAVEDTASNPGQEVVRQANSVVSDTTPPQLSSFDLDLDEGMMTLSFSEAVNLSIFVLSYLVIAEDEFDRTEINFSPFESTFSAPELRNVEIVLSQEELNEIKRNQICRDNTTCYLYFPKEGSIGTTIRDIAGNEVKNIQFFDGTPVDNFVSDTTPPSFANLTFFDLDSGFISLSFDETINASSIDLTALHFHSWYFNNSTLTTYDITGGDVLSDNRAYIDVQLTEEDINRIKVDRSLCTDNTNCWVRFSSLLVQDMVANAVQAVVPRNSFEETEYARNFSNDVTSPQLDSFEFDLNSGTLRFTFDEPIDPVTLQASALTLQDAHSSAVNYTIISGSTTSTVLSTVMVMELSEHDVIEIKTLTDLATSELNTYITFTSSFIRDTSSVQLIPGGLSANPIQPRINGVSALAASNFTDDVTNPQLTAFTQLDLNRGTFRVTFDEPVATDSFNATAFTLKSMVNGGSSLTLSGGAISYSPTVSNCTEVEIEFSSLDLSNLKLITDLGTQRSDSYLYIDSGAISDMSGNPVDQVARILAEQVAIGEYIPDTTPPQLVYFSLDMNEGILHLSFDDIILASSFEVTLIALQSNFSSGNTYFLTGGAATTENSYNITVTLSSFDLNEIKATLSLATSESSTHLVMAPNAITDVAGVEIIGLTETNTFMVIDFIPDITPPELQIFTFDLGGGLMVLNFSEAVDTVSFEPKQITLQNNESNTDISSFVQYTFIEGRLESTADREIYTFFPSIEDFNNIKALLTLSTGESDTYITIRSSAFIDLSGNMIVAIPQTAALQTSMFSNDLTSPTLSSYIFDLNKGLITLTFSESIQIDSFNFTGFVIRNSQLVSAMEYQITNGLTNTMGGNIIELMITLTDLNNIKALTNLATSNVTTFLSILPGTYEDTSGNPGTVYGATAARSPQIFIPDVTPPELDSYSFNLGLGILTFNFSETVDPGTLNSSTLTLQSSQAFPVSALNLSDVFTNSSIGNIIEVFLTIADLDVIKKTASFATARGNTFLALTNNTIQDIAGNLVKVISIFNALQTNNFIPDTVQPRLMTFDLDLDDGILTLTFTEGVQTRDTLNVTSIFLHSGQVSSRENYSLTGGTIQVRGLQPSVPIKLSTYDLNSIKDLPVLATSASSVYISITDNATTDISGNLLIGRTPQQAATVNIFTADTTPPILVAFEFRLIEEPLQLVLSFDETIDLTSLNVILLCLRDGLSLFSLAGDEFQEVDPSLVTINISDTTLTAIRNAPGLARNDSTTLLNIASDAITDTVGNPISPVTDFMVTFYNADLLPPFIASFTFDLNLGQLILTFDAAVQGMDLNPSLLSILDAPASTNQISIVSSSQTVLSEEQILIMLEKNNLNDIKLNKSVAISADTTYILHEADLVCDIANNCADEVTAAVPVPVGIYIPDFSEPVLESFDFNTNNRILTLYFNEAVNASSLDARQITFQNERAPYPQVEYTLTSTGVLSSNGHTVDLLIKLIDKNKMKALGDILITSFNTYISVTSELIRDMAGNFVEEIRPRYAIGVNTFTGDSENPDVTTANLDLTTGVLILNFSETVDLTTFKVSELTFSSSRSLAVAKHKLTDSLLVSTTLDTSNPSLVPVQLSQFDLSTIKSLEMCSGVATDDCFLSFSSDLVNDTVSQQVNERRISNLLRTGVDPDTAGPVLMEFESFNFVNDTITLIFDEPVNASTVDPTQIIIQDLFVTVTSHYLLVSGTVSNTGLRSITLTLSQSDLYTIQQDPALCTVRGNCYLRLDTGFVSDFVGNPNEAIPEGFPGMIVSQYITDTATPCVSESEMTNRGDYTWPESRGGTDVILDCAVGSVSGTDGVAVRLCLQNGEWGDSDLSQCITIVESQLEDLEERIANENVTEDNYEEIIDELDGITAEADTPDEQTSDNIEVVSEVLSSIAALVSSPDVVVSETTVEESVQILDDVEEWPAEVVQEESDEIIQSFETITTSLVEQENFTAITVVTEDIALIGERVSGKDLQWNGRRFSSNRTVNGTLDVRTGNETTRTLEEDEIVAAFLHPQLFQEFDDGGDVAIAFTLYDNPDNLFPVQSTFNDTDGRSGEVTRIGTAVIGILVPGKESVQNLSQPVQIQLHINAPPDNGTITNGTCVFWNFTLNGADGGWSEVGCVTLRGNLSSNVITCQCNHLTNFAALVDICSRVDGCDPIPSGLAFALDIISIIGVSLSLFGLVITVLTLLVFEEFRKRDATKFNVQLCIAIFCMMLVFVIGIDRTEIYGGCVAVSALIHYFTLVAVMWMGATAILMFQKLVIVFTEITTKYIIEVSIVCWTLPIVPVVVSLIIDRDFMVTYQNLDTPEQTLEFCFIGNSAVFFTTFLAPILVILLFNCALFVVVITVLIRHQRYIMKQKNKDMDRKTAGRLLINVVGVMFLFGLTWLFGAFTVVGATLVFQVLFAVFNSLQGFFIFLFFCVISKDARELWKETLTCGRYKSNTSRNLTGTGTTPRYNVNSKTSSTDIRTSTCRLSYTTPKSEFNENSEEASHVYQKELKDLSSSTHSHTTTKATDLETALDTSQVLINPAILPIAEEHDSFLESNQVAEISGPCTSDAGENLGEHQEEPVDLLSSKHLHATTEATDHENLLDISQVLINPAILPKEQQDSCHELSPADEVSDLATSGNLSDN